MKSFLFFLYRFIGSPIFFVLMFIFTVVYSFFCLLCYKLPYPIKYRIINFWTGGILFLLRLLCGIRYTVTGLENIPQGSCVILSKHQSTFETFALPKLFHSPAIILKKELLHIPFFGWGLRLLEPISIDRTIKANAMEQILTQGANYLKKGRSILVFPEGTRTKPGERTRYKIGGALLAYTTSYPVLPVAHNAGCYWPKGGFLKRPGTIRVIIGPLINTHGLSAEEILARTQDWIETTIKEQLPC